MHVDLKIKGREGLRQSAFDIWNNRNLRGWEEACSKMCPYVVWWGPWSSASSDSVFTEHNGIAGKVDKTLRASGVTSGPSSRTQGMSAGSNSAGTSGGGEGCTSSFLHHYLFFWKGLPIAPQSACKRGWHYVVRTWKMFSGFDLCVCARVCVRGAETKWWSVQESCCHPNLPLLLLPLGFLVPPAALPEAHPFLACHWQIALIYKTDNSAIAWVHLIFSN